jgi:hypothetical protein
LHKKFTGSEFGTEYLHIPYKSKVVINVYMSQKNYENRKQEQQIQQSTSLWSQMAEQVLDSLTDKNMTATMELQNLEIDVPKARGPEGRDLGSAKCIVNGKIVWTTELHKT